MLLVGAPWRSVIGKMLAGRRGEETGSTVADSHQEDAARREMLLGRAPSGRCKPAPGSNCDRKCQCEAPSGRHCPQGDALWQSVIRKTLPAGRCAKEQHREDADDRELPAGSCTRKQHREAASGSHTAAKGRWQGRSSGV